MSSENTTPRPVEIIGQPDKQALARFFYKMIKSKIEKEREMQKNDNQNVR